MTNVYLTKIRPTKTYYKGITKLMTQTKKIITNIKKNNSEGIQEAIKNEDSIKSK